MEIHVSISSIHSTSVLQVQNTGPQVSHAVLDIFSQLLQTIYVYMYECFKSTNLNNKCPLSLFLNVFFEGVISTFNKLNMLIKFLMTFYS